MNTLLCTSIANWCKKEGAVSEEDYPIILYGIQVFMNSTLKLLGIFVISALLHHFWTTLISTIVFCSMRCWTGGWHSKSHLGCFCTMLISCLIPSFFMGIHGEWAEWLLKGIMIYSAYRVFRYAPCNSKVNPIEAPTLLHRKRIGSIIETAGLLIITFVCPDIKIGWLMILPSFANAIMLTF